jgi:PAS domain S-box-containing protein
MTTELTARKLRRTGLSVIGDVRWGTHFCYFYETKQDLLDTLVPYFREGLEGKEFCVWVVSPALSAEEAKHALGQVVPDLEGYLAEGALEIHRHDEWYLCDGRWDPQRVLQSWREKLNQTSVKDYAGLRASGDGGWIQNDEWLDFREYEKQVDEMIADQRSIILCTYPLTTSPGDQVFDVAGIHQVAVARRHGNWEIIETPELKEAKAEIKRLNDELEQKVEERTRELATTNEALRAEIAERKLAEEAVKQAEDRIRLVIDTIPTMAWSLRPDGVVDFLNQRWLDYTGLSFEDAMTGPNRIVHPEDLSRTVEKWLKHMAAGESCEDEIRLRRADGEYRWFLIRTVSLLDAQGNIVKWYGTGADIEDRKRAEAALNAQALRYKTLMETSTDSIYVLDEKGDLQEANAAFLRRRGYSAAETKGLNVADWDAQSSHEQLQKRLRELVGGSEVFETRHRGKDGSGFDVEACVTSVRIGGEQLFFCVTRDITKRKQAEQALRESEARFRRLLASNIIGVVFWTLQGDILEANDLFLNTVGYTREDLLQGRVSWKNLTPPECAAVDEKALRELMATGTCSPFEKEYIRKDCSRVSVLIGSALLEPHKKSGSSFVMDISDRKQAEEGLRRSEEKFKALFDIAPVGISVLDRHRKVVDANPALERITRLSKEELLNGSYRRRTYLNADGTPKLANELASARAITENRPINDVETGIVIENGEIVWTQVSVAPLVLSDVSAVVITQDITERKKAEQQIEHFADLFQALSRRLLDVQEEERRHLARELHDEIIQTLTAAKLNLKIIAPDVPAAVAGRLEDSTQLLDRLLQQVRELSLDLRPPLLDDLGLVPALRWLADQQAQRAGLRVTFTANVERLEMDPPLRTACFRVAQEAITNAIRHARAATVAVELRAESDRVWLAVHDDGVGFDKGAMQERAAHGASVGLLSMKERASILGGELEVNSTPGRGTKIQAWFPLAGARPEIPPEIG